MKKISLLLVLASFGLTALAQPPVQDISNHLELQGAFYTDLEFPGEGAVKGSVGDFNNDGIDDFFITGLYVANGANKSFFHIYLGQEGDIPKLVYQDNEFIVGGNGATDCVKLVDGSWLVAVQGGKSGNWENPFAAYLYNLSVDGETVTFSQVTQLDFATGRASILLLDMNKDGLFDIYQHGWKANASWDATSTVYLNVDETNEMFDLDPNSIIRPANNTLATRGDLNNDGLEDILIPVQNLGLFVYLNKGDGTFSELKVTSFPVADRDDEANIRGEEDGNQAQFVDVDGDGIPEIILSCVIDNTGGDWNFVLKLFKYNPANQTFSEMAQTNKAGEPVVWTGGQRGDFAVGDFDGDGKVDIIVSAENQKEKTWGCRTYFMSGNGKGGFDQIEVTYGDANPNGIVAMSRRAQFGRYLVGDFNGDGSLDLIQAGMNYYAKDPGLRLYLNKHTGTSIGNVDATDNIRVYADGRTLYVENVEQAEVSIINISGVICQRSRISANESLNLNVAAGVYVAKVRTEAGMVTKKIVVK